MVAVADGTKVPPLYGTSGKPKNGVVETKEWSGGCSSLVVGDEELGTYWKRYHRYFAKLRISPEKDDEYFSNIPFFLFGVINKKF